MEGEAANFTVLQLFILGGGFMWPLLFFSVAAVAIVLERCVYLIIHNLRMDDLQERITGYIQTGDLEEGRRYLAGHTKRRMGARILLTLLDHASLPEHLMERSVEARALGCVNALENGFNFLTAIGSLSPLTGFLGTVSGMIGAFKSIAEATDVNAQIVANGIYEALITTVFGLIIAIIAMTAHSIFTHLVDKFAADVEITCTELIIELAQKDKHHEDPAEQTLSC